MNSLHVMKSDGYNGFTSVKMAGLDSMASLGLTRSEIKKIFHHAVYDGVYATPEELAHGGGCLSLLNHLADWCDVERGEITGLWDMGNKLELVYGDGMMNNKKIKELNTLVFGTMPDFLHGQSSHH